METPYRNRENAGQDLAKRLKTYVNGPDGVVLALPRGGINVAFEVAKALNLPLDVVVVRKLGVPDQPELAMGAIASGGVRVLNQQLMRQAQISNERIESVAQQEVKELMRQERLYRNGRPPVDLEHKTVILIDDGLATGATMRAAITAIREQKPQQIIIAVPVATPSMCQELESEVDEIICLKTPEPFISVGTWYDDFSQTTDEEVIQLLSRAKKRQQNSKGHSTI